MNRARWNPQYYQYVLATDPIGYWMQDEKQGAVSYDMVTARSNGARNGAYTGVTLGQPGIGDGRTAPFFDGANDYNNIFSASFQAAFNGAEGTLMVWARVAGAGVWVDGVVRLIVTLQVDANNRVLLNRTVINNQLQLFYEAGNVIEQILLNGLTTTNFFYVAITWSAIADEVIAYYDGMQTGLTEVGLGIWAGNLGANSTVVGAFTAPAAFVWHGDIAHAAVWDRPLTPAQIAVLYEEAFA